jgi:hypothetical protein
MEDLLNLLVIIINIISEIYKNDWLKKIIFESEWKLYFKKII